jgi:hypothetical protein
VVNRENVISIRSENNSLKKTFYAIGSVAAVIIVVLIPVQIVLYLLWPHPTTIPAWFELFNRNYIIGLISFDFLYMISNILMIFLYLAMFFALYEKKKALCILALTLALVGITTFLSSNTSLEMLSVSHQYALAISEQDKNVLLAAGQTLYYIWKGTAYAISYVLSGISLILFFVAMIPNRSFKKNTAYIGLSSGILMLVPATAGIIGMTMALLSLIPWMIFCILVVQDFYRLFKNDN